MGVQGLNGDHCSGAKSARMSLRTDTGVIKTQESENKNVTLLLSNCSGNINLNIRLLWII